MSKIHKITFIILVALIALYVSFSVGYLLSENRAKVNQAALDSKKPDVNTLFKMVNEERIKQGKSALAIDSRLQASANSKCSDMLYQNYYSHTDPSGDTWGFIKKVMPNYKFAGENLAVSNQGTQAVFAGWLNSKEHRDILLKDDFTITGFAVCTKPNYAGFGTHHNAFLVVEHFSGL